MPKKKKKKEPVKYEPVAFRPGDIVRATVLVPSPAQCATARNASWRSDLTRRVRADRKTARASKTRSKPGARRSWTRGQKATRWRANELCYPFFVDVADSEASRPVCCSASAGGQGGLRRCRWRRRPAPPPSQACPGRNSGTPGARGSAARAAQSRPGRSRLRAPPTRVDASGRAKA
jgi:hypothetical protein